MSGRRESIEGEESAAGDGHVAEAVACFVGPFGACGHWDVDEEYAVEIDEGICENDGAFDFA